MNLRDMKDIAVNVPCFEIKECRCQRKVVCSYILVRASSACARMSIYIDQQKTNDETLAWISSTVVGATRVCSNSVVLNRLAVMLELLERLVNDVSINKVLYFFFAWIYIFDSVRESGTCFCVYVSISDLFDLCMCLSSL